VSVRKVRHLLQRGAFRSPGACCPKGYVHSRQENLDRAEYIEFATPRLGAQSLPRERPFTPTRLVPTLVLHKVNMLAEVCQHGSFGGTYVVAGRQSGGRGHAFAPTCERSSDNWNSCTSSTP
jgi:hypothetical protein